MRFNTDDTIQAMFTLLKDGYIRWRDCEDNQDYEWYYAEATHYMVREKKTGAVWFVKAKSPSYALEYVANKIGGNHD